MRGTAGYNVHTPTTPWGVWGDIRTITLCEGVSKGVLGGAHRGHTRGGTMCRGMCMCLPCIFYFILTPAPCPQVRRVQEPFVCHGDMCGRCVNIVPSSPTPCYEAITRFIRDNKMRKYTHFEHLSHLTDLSLPNYVRWAHTPRTLLKCSRNRPQKQPLERLPPLDNRDKVSKTNP